jgi:hypothetical protein
MRTAASLESDPMAWVDALSSATKPLFNERRHEEARAEPTEIVDSPQRQLTDVFNLAASYCSSGYLPGSKKRMLEVVAEAGAPNGSSQINEAQRFGVLTKAYVALSGISRHQY